MTNFFIIIFAGLFTLLAVKKFNWGTFLLILLFPAYLIRFEAGLLPSTLLELAFGIIFLVWIIRFSSSDIKKIQIFFLKNKIFFLFTTLFILSSAISIFTSDMWWYSFGQWRAYFLEPFLIFLILIGRSEELSFNNLAWSLIVSTFSISAFAIFQKITKLGISPEAGDRMTSFFSSPNAIGLYTGPILALLLYPLIAKWKDKDVKKIVLLIVFTLITLVSIFFSKSLGTILAIGGGLAFFIILITRKKLVLLLFAILLLFPLSFSSTREFILSKERSSSNRLVLWQYSYEFLTASPKNFVFGTGIRQFFRKIQKPHYDPQKMERLIYPHNIFLNFWTEIGLIGLVGFTGIFIFLTKFTIEIYKKNILLGASILAALGVFLLHGLIDVPYFKNDLSMMFWTISALIIITRNNLANHARI